MSTSPISFRRRARRGALALLVSATVMPASSALAQQGDTPADYPGMPGNPQSVATHFVWSFELYSVR